MPHERKASNTKFICPGSRVDPLCRKVFTRKADLHRHLKSTFHRSYSDRPYGCKYEGCEYRFTQRGQFIGHDIREHGAPRLQCPHCDKTYTEPSSVCRHKKEKHKDVAGTIDLYVLSPTPLSETLQEPESVEHSVVTDSVGRSKTSSPTPQSTESTYLRRASNDSIRFQEVAPIKTMASELVPVTQRMRRTHGATSMKTPAPLFSARNPSPPLSEASTWSNTASPPPSTLSPFSTYSTPVGSPTQSARYSHRHFSPSSSRDVSPTLEDSFVGSIRCHPSRLTSRNIRRHDEQSSTYGFSPYLRASSARHKKGATCSSSSSSSPSHFTGLTTPPDSPVTSPEVIYPSTSTSPAPTFHSGCMFNATENEYTLHDTYNIHNTGGETCSAKSQNLDTLNTHFQYGMPAYNTDVFRPAQQDIFQVEGHLYPTPQLPTSTLPMTTGHDGYMDPFPGYAEYANGASPPQPQVEQQLLTSVTQAAIQYAVYPSTSVGYIDMSTVPLDQSEAKPQLELDFSDFSWESDPAFNAIFDDTVAAWFSASDSTEQTMMFADTNRQWTNGMQFASY